MKDRIVGEGGDSRHDAELVRIFQQGDRDVFETLVRRHQKRIFNLCFRMLGEYGEAADFAQETFFRAYKGLGRYRAEASFSTWLYRIAVNACRNRLASQAHRFRKKTVSMDRESRAGENPGPLQIQDPNPPPLERIEAKEKAAAIQQAILALSPDHREVVVLKDIEGFSYEEISSITGENLGTVKSRLSRARQALKEQLRPILR